MAAEVIELEVRLAGVEAAVRDLQRAKDGLEDTADSAEEADDKLKDFTRALTGATQRVQGAASAVQALVSATGSHDRTAGLVASLAGVVSQGTAVGAMFGGPFAGAIAGAVAGLAGLATETDNARHALEELLTQANLTANAVSHAIADESGDSWSGAMAAARQELDRLNERAAELRETAGSTLRGILDPIGVAAARTELHMVEGEIALITHRIGELSDAAAESPLTPSTGGGRGMASFLDLDPALRRREVEHRDRPRGRARTDDGFDENAFLDSTYELAERESARREVVRMEEEAANEERRAASIDFWAEQDRLREESYAREALEAKEHAQELIDIEREKEEAIAALAEEEINATKAKRRQALEDMAAQQTEFMQLGMNVVGMLTDALGEVASGEKTAEQAFKGLAKAFLEMISQYASLKAASEFADAIGAFAQYDYARGAQHVAAGVAFTAVAVATGVGAAAINTAPPSAPARPDSSRNGAGEKGGGDIVINWNSPVVTASTRDELGRDMAALVDAGRARYG